MLVLAAWVLVVFAAAGCAPKQKKTSMIFDLDGVFNYSGESKVEEPDKSWREKGLTLAAQKDYEGAIEAFKRYIEEEPTGFFGFNALGVCYKHLGDHSQAMRNFERALEFAERPEEKAKIFANIGNLYFATRRPQAALNHYKEAAGLAPDNPLYYILIARTFLVLKDDDRAAKVLAQAEKMLVKAGNHRSEDDDGLGYYLMGYCFLALGDEDKLIKYLRLAFESSPEKYVRRFEKDSSDQKNLFYTVRADPRIKKLVRKYKERKSSDSWLLSFK